MRLWKYHHFKWKDYEVIWIARNSETLEEMVVYRALYKSDEFGENALRVRSKKMFEENTVVDWKEVARFKYVWDE